VIYPLVVTAVSQVAFHHEANGSLIERDGVVVGSELIGQNFAAPEYFHPRPSAAGDGYDGAASSGSNLGPNSPDLLAAVEERAVAYREENELPADAPVPVDAVTASGSGLDPHISVANATLQAPRVAQARGLDLDVVEELIEDHTADRAFGVLGEPAVNVLLVNLDLDVLAPTT
jgi:K+-transporting ATPase ATPase C chain